MGCSGSFEESSDREIGTVGRCEESGTWGAETTGEKTSQVLPCELAYEAHSPEGDLGGLKR